MLKDKAAIHQSQDTHLIVQEFCQHLVETVKTKKQSKEAFIKNMPNRHNPREVAPHMNQLEVESAKKYVSKLGTNTKVQQ